jgi:hypothetical protein
MLRLLGTLLLVISLCPLTGTGQSTSPDTACVQKDLRDVIRQALRKPPGDKPEEKGSLLLLPIIGSNPATGLHGGDRRPVRLPDAGELTILHAVGERSIHDEESVYFDAEK